MKYCFTAIAITCDDRAGEVRALQQLPSHMITEREKFVNTNECMQVRGPSYSWTPERRGLLPTDRCTSRLLKRLWFTNPYHRGPAWTPVLYRFKTAPLGGQWYERTPWTNPGGGPSPGGQLDSRTPMLS